VPETEALTLARARNGDLDAFRSIVERHSAGVFRVAFRITRNEPDAEDVVQETFLKAYGELGRFEARSTVGTWLHRIAANCAIDLIRKRASHPTLADGEPSLLRLASQEPGPERATSGRELRARVEAALETLTPIERVAFTLRHLEEQSIEDVSAALGQTPTAARHSVFRAVAKVRRALRPAMRVEP
jgi:RNA polymerase sigma-70 factor (ECF subfamily)